MGQLFHVVRGDEVASVQQGPRLARAKEGQGATGRRTQVDQLMVAGLVHDGRDVLLDEGVYIDLLYGPLDAQDLVRVAHLLERIDGMGELLRFHHQHLVRL